MEKKRKKDHRQDHNIFLQELRDIQVRKKQVMLEKEQRQLSLKDRLKQKLGFNKVQSRIAQKEEEEEADSPLETTPNEPRG